MTSNRIYHYVYRITNTVENKHYYGKRTSKIEPKLDLGFRYFSSSADKEFKADQKLNPQNYRYKIVQTFDNVEEACHREIKLHYLFDVKIHSKFYNKCNAKTDGFDRTGILHTAEYKEMMSKMMAKIRTGKKHTEETKRKIGDSNHKTPRIHTQEARLAISKSNKTRKYSEQARQKFIESTSGRNNYRFSGYYVTPLFTTDIRKKILDIGICISWCKNPCRKISKLSFAKSKFLQKFYIWVDLEGKTYKELGFNFLSDLFPLI